MTSIKCWRRAFTSATHAVRSARRVASQTPQHHAQNRFSQQQHHHQQQHNVSTDHLARVFAACSALPVALLGISSLLADDMEDNDDAPNDSIAIGPSLPKKTSLARDIVNVGGECFTACVAGYLSSVHHLTQHQVRDAIVARPYDMPLILRQCFSRAGARTAVYYNLMAACGLGAATVQDLGLNEVAVLIGGPLLGIFVVASSIPDILFGYSFGWMFGHLKGRTIARQGVGLGGLLPLRFTQINLLGVGPKVFLIGLGIAASLPSSFTALKDWENLEGSEGDQIDESGLRKRNNFSREWRYQYSVKGGSSPRTKHLETPKDSIFENDDDDDGDNYNDDDDDGPKPKENIVEV